MKSIVSSYNSPQIHQFKLMAFLLLFSLIFSKFSFASNSLRLTYLGESFMNLPAGFYLNLIPPLSVNYKGYGFDILYDKIIYGKVSIFSDSLSWDNVESIIKPSDGIVMNNSGKDFDGGTSFCTVYYPSDSFHLTINIVIGKIEDDEMVRLINFDFKGRKKTFDKLIEKDFVIKYCGERYYSF